MNKTLIAIAAAALAVALAPAAQAGFPIPSLDAKPAMQRTGWDGEDYAEALEERLEAVEERAEARAEALEDGEGYASRQSSARDQSSRAEVQRASTQPEPAPAKSPISTPEGKDTKTEVKKADASEPKNSDVDGIASVENGKCKKYFSSVGMTLSVPCE